MSALPDLAGVLADLAEDVGRTGALALAREFGGTRVYVPESMTEDHRLAALLGVGPASRLSWRFGGETIEIPLGPYSRQGMTTRAIERYLADGKLTHAEIAREVGCTERWVRAVKAGLSEKEDPDQLKLFG